METGLDLFSQQDLNPLASKHYHGGLINASEAWKKAQTLPEVMSPEDKRKVQTAIAGELGILQVAYPSQARNFSQGEIQTTCALWGEVFGRVHPRLLHEAIQRFITEDRKGFFPAPGQIVGYVEKIIGQINEAEAMERHHRQMERLLAEMKTKNN